MYDAIDYYVNYHAPSLTHDSVTIVLLEQPKKNKCSKKNIYIYLVIIL